MGNEGAGAAAVSAQESSARSYAGSLSGKVTTLSHARLQQAGIEWRGGAITTSTGETVSVLVSQAFPLETVTPESWAEFLTKLVHGDELSELTMYVAPLTEVRQVCGGRALGCYSRDTGVSVGEVLPDGTTPEEVVRHEYGHHIALYRSNAPWRAIDWGPKHWATVANVCARVARGEAFPGNERDDYSRNPGEAWAEVYRLMDERKVGITTARWQIIAPSFYPTEAALQAAERDALQPWTTGRAIGVSPQARAGQGLVDQAVDATRRNGRGHGDPSEGRASSGCASRARSPYDHQARLGGRRPQEADLGNRLRPALGVRPGHTERRGGTGDRRRVEALSARIGSARKSLRVLVAATVVVLAFGVVLGTGRTATGADLDATLTVVRSATLTATAPAASARAAATWCGTPAQRDASPNAVAGYPVRWIYAIPADGQDRFSNFANVMQTDWETIDSWWRREDPSRAPRADLAQFACGLQLDLSTLRLRQSGSQVAARETPFEQVFDSLDSQNLTSPGTRYVVYYDGPVGDENICGVGGPIPGGLGLAVVSVRACCGRRERGDRRARGSPHLGRCSRSGAEQLPASGRRPYL